MRFRPTPAFTEKVAALANVSGVLTELSAMLKLLEASTLKELLARKDAPRARALAPNIFALSTDRMQCYFAIATADGQEEAVLLDFTTELPTPPTGLTHPRDPRTNPSLNPLTNASLNPLVNASLNPLVNSSLNPMINASLNPLLNPSLNPITNPSLNPLINSSLNPAINHSLNPLINHSLNPLINLAFDGPFVYDKTANRLGFLVRVNKTVLLRFDMMAQMIGIGVATGSGGYVLFDKSNQWTGYLVPNGQGGYLEFDKNGAWIGFVA